MLLDAHRVVDPVRKLRKMLRKAASKEPTPKEIHELRTAARRFEMTAESLACESKRRRRRLLRSLKGIRKRAGKVRDLDVLTEKTNALKVGGDTECVVRLLERLGADRQRHAQKLKRLLDAHGAKLRRRLKPGVAHRKALIAAGQQRARRSAAAIATRALALGADLRASAHVSRRALHPYRLKAKELLYLLQMLTGADHLALAHRLHEVKDAIGEWHDWERLIELAAQSAAADHHARCGLAHALRSADDRQYRRALTATVHLHAVLRNDRAKGLSGTGGRMTVRGDAVFAALAP